jgi:glutamate---cysteine ligase / carboxylate-amine ligase
MTAPTFTIGIEEEYQTVDPHTFDLRSHIQTEIMAKGQRLMKERVKAEMHQAVVEVGTGVCRTVKEASDDLKNLRRQMIALTEENGLLLVAGATHPFADWRSQEVNPDERYVQLVEDMQMVARANLIFGLHVHVGIEDRETLIQIMNQMRYFLPHLLALSTSSPFWMGRDTGLKSYRTTIFRRFPRTGVPDHFSSWSEYENYIKLLVELHCIDDARKIWWDVRPHPTFGTLEFRVCDVPTQPEVSVMLAALVQAIIVKLCRLRARNQGFRLYRRALIEENKWRAARWGLDGKLIDFGKREEVPMRDLAIELLGFIDDVVDDLNSRWAVEYVHTVLRDGTSADRQLAVYRATGDLTAVVRDIVEHTKPDGSGGMQG